MITGGGLNADHEAAKGGVRRAKIWRRLPGAHGASIAGEDVAATILGEREAVDRLRATDSDRRSRVYAFIAGCGDSAPRAWRWRPGAVRHPGRGVGVSAKGRRSGSIQPIRAGPLHSGQRDASREFGFTSCCTACLCWYPKRCRQTVPRRCSKVIPATRPRTRIA